MTTTIQSSPGRVGHGARRPVLRLATAVVLLGLMPPGLAHAYLYPDGCTTTIATKEVDTYTSAVFTPESAAGCAAMCAKWVTMCKQFASAQNKCFTRSITANYGVEKAICKTSAEKFERTNCLAQERLYETFGAAKIKADTATARLQCKTREPSCVTRCLSNFP